MIGKETGNQGFDLLFSETPTFSTPNPALNTFQATETSKEPLLYYVMCHHLCLWIVLYCVPSSLSSSCIVLCAIIFVFELYCIVCHTMSWKYTSYAPTNYVLHELTVYNKTNVIWNAWKNVSSLKYISGWSIFDSNLIASLSGDSLASLLITWPTHRAILGHQKTVHIVYYTTS